MVAFVCSRLTERSYCHKSSGCSCADSRGCAFRSAQSMRVLLVAVLRDPMVWWCLQQSPSQPRAPGSSSRCHHGTPSLSPVPPPPTQWWGPPGVCIRQAQPQRSQREGQEDLRGARHAARSWKQGMDARLLQPPRTHIKRET